MKTIKLTDEIQNAILASVRAGGYPQIAAQAWGVPEELFNQWLKWGTKKTAREPYKSFALKLNQAKAQARLKAEMSAYDADPKFWLKNGPGKETPDNPGWSTMIKPILTSDNRTVNLFTSPDFLQFLSLMRTVLAPFPEALAALTSALEKPINTPPTALPPPIPKVDTTIDPSLN